MKPTVLFLCIHNAGRSQMALGWFERLDDSAGQRVEFVRRVRDEIRTRVETLLTDLQATG